MLSALLLLPWLAACGEAPVAEAPGVEPPAAADNAPAGAQPLTPEHIDKMDDPAKLGPDCEGGDGPSCFNLGLMALTGDVPGVPKDPQAALAHFERACGLEVDAACRNHEALNQQLSGGDGDTRTAWATACDAGDATACLTLGRALKADEDYAGAAVRFEAGCAIAGGRPCTDLGVLTLAGLGVPPDAMAALALFKKGCAGMDTAGCMNAARAYYIGEGTEQSDRMARQYLTTACQGGSEPACERLSAITPLEEQGTPGGPGAQ